MQGSGEVLGDGKTYAAVEPRKSRPQGGMTVREGWKGGDELALTVELVKE